MSRSGMPRENGIKDIKVPNDLNDFKVLKAFAISC